MNKDDLYKSMNGISDEILERSEQNMLPVPDAGKTKRKYFSIAASIALVIIIGIILVISQSRKIKASNLMEGIEAENNISGATDGAYSHTITDFSIRLFKECNKTGENQLISPVSVLAALGMCANGAEGETLLQMEQVFGTDRDTINGYIFGYMSNLTHSEKSKLSMANSIWFEERLKDVNREFLQTNANYYGADIYKRTFDEKAKNEINKWVKNKTDGMIDKILDEDIDEDTVMYLINALSFEAEWENIYRSRNVRDGIFTTESGLKRKVSFMYSTEGDYLEDENTTGFIKYYKGREYAFVALLPKENINMTDYIDSLTCSKIEDLLSSHDSSLVHAGLPKFSYDYNLSLSETLKALGMDEVFDPYRADLSGIASPEDGNIYISDVLHKTFITVDEKGTKAGAATKIDSNDAGAPLDFHEVFLDRPFVYMLIDCNSNIPFFIGTVIDIGTDIDNGK